MVFRPDAGRALSHEKIRLLRALMAALRAGNQRAETADRYQAIELRARCIALSMALCITETTGLSRHNGFQ